MSNNPKSLKEKSYAAPRLTPRPTAASAARAAQNAFKRNLSLPIPTTTQRQSPVRSPPSPATSKVKTAIQRYGRSDSKTDMKAKDSHINRNLDIDVQSLQAEVVNHNDENYSTLVDEVIVVKTIEYEPAGNVPNGPNNGETFNFENTMDRLVPVVDDAEKVDVPGVSLEDVQPLIKIPSCPQTPRSVVSRPQTPQADSSRPQTPRAETSRPQTPQKPSRPATPAHSIQRHNTPSSRPSTPINKPKTPTKTIRPTTPVSSNIAQSCSKDEDIKIQYTNRQKEFYHLKKELDLKQQAAIKLYQVLRNLRERLINEGASAGLPQVTNELVIYNVADWTSDKIAEMCRDAGATSLTESDELFNNTANIDDSTLAEIQNKAMSIPSHFADLCLQAFTARQELIDWLKEYVAKEDIDNEAMERITRYNKQGLDMCEALRELKARSDEAVNTVTMVSRRACRERATLLSVGQTLVREIARLRQDLKTQTVPVAQVHEIIHESDAAKTLAEVRKELDEERTTKTSMKDKLTNAEYQLKQQKMRIAKMDRQLREAEASIASLTGTVKSLEDQSRQREVQFESRARKLKESLKTGEVTNNHVVQQRDNLQAEVTELKEQIQTMTSQHKTAIQDLNKQLKEISSSLEEERKTVNKEKEIKKSLEESIGNNQNTIEALEAKVVELENSKPNPDFPTEREMDLWAELQATKDTLHLTEEEVISCKREKVRFLETLTKIAESENKVGLQQKLAADLLSKEEIINKLQIQLRDQMKTVKLNEQKVIQYEQYVHNLQAHYRSIVSSQEIPHGISYQDLQQEIMNLKMGLLDSVHRNDDLSEMLAQKEQQLEQQDKTSRAQARVIKVREELINMLKKKETEQSRELGALQQDLEHRMKIVDEVNKQIAAKADEIQELFSTLENKQQQIHRLEKIVLALEEQQRRAQAQRTRHEEKIAALEHELAAGGNRRERKFFLF